MDNSLKLLSKNHARVIQYAVITPVYLKAAQQ